MCLLFDKHVSFEATVLTLDAKRGFVLGNWKAIEIGNKMNLKGDQKIAKANRRNHLLCSAVLLSTIELWLIWVRSAIQRLVVLKIDHKTTIIAYKRSMTHYLVLFEKSNIVQLNGMSVFEVTLSFSSRTFYCSFFGKLMCFSFWQSRSTFLRRGFGQDHINLS